MQHHPVKDVGHHELSLRRLLYVATVLALTLASVAIVSASPSLLGSKAAELQQHGDITHWICTIPPCLRPGWRGSRKIAETP